MISTRLFAPDALGRVTVLTSLLLALSGCGTASDGSAGTSRDSDLTQRPGAAFDRVTYRYTARVQVPSGYQYAEDQESIRDGKMHLQLLPEVSSPMGHAEPDGDGSEVIDGVATFTGTFTVEAQDREVALRLKYGTIYDWHVFDPTSNAKAIPTKLVERFVEETLSATFELEEVSREAVPVEREIGCDRAENTDSYVIRTAARVGYRKIPGSVVGKDFTLQVAYDDDEASRPLAFDSVEKNLDVVRYCRAPQAPSSTVRVKIAAFEADLFLDDDLGFIDADMTRGQRLTKAPLLEFHYWESISQVWAAVE
jgi:hypothetical protein